MGVPWRRRRPKPRRKGGRGGARPHHGEAAADTDARAAPEGEVCVLGEPLRQAVGPAVRHEGFGIREVAGAAMRSEEHTSELQSQSNLVCRLLLEKKKITDLAQRTDRHT